MWSISRWTRITASTDVLDLVDHPALDGLGELDLADQLRQLDARAQRLPADAAVLALVASWSRPSASSRASPCTSRAPIHALRTASIWRRTCRLRSSIFSSVSSSSTNVTSSRMLRSSFLSAIAHLMIARGDGRRARDRLDDGELAALDALGDLDFAFAREQRDRAHLAQVHADGVVGLVERAGRQVELELLGPFAGAVEQLVFAVLLLGVDDLDAGAAERAEQVVELVRRGDVGRQQLVDLVVEQVALFLADGDELLYFVVFFFDRQRRVLLNCSSLDSARIKHAAYDCRQSAVTTSFLRSHKRVDLGRRAPRRPSSCSRSISRWTSARSRVEAQPLERLHAVERRARRRWVWRPISSTSAASSLLRRSSKRLR